MCTTVSTPPAEAASASSTVSKKMPPAERTSFRTAGAGAGNRASQIASTVRPNTELTYWSTWQSSPVYEKKLTGALKAEMRDTIQPSACVQESQTRCVQAPMRIDSGASAQLLS